MTPYLFAAWLIAAAAAIDCSAKELEKYDFASILGVYTDSFLRNTPPTKTTFTWSLGICQDLDGVAECPAKSDLCGTAHVKTNSEDVLTQVIGFGGDLKHEYSTFANDDESGIDMHIRNLAWGDELVDARIRFVCDHGGGPEEINKLKIEKWDAHTFEGRFPSPAVCTRDSKKTPVEDGGESWGWFTWIFIFMVLFLSIYIIGGAWFQYNKGNSIDFQSALKEVLENFVDLLRGLPSFLKEVVEKVTGNSSRNEYSAV